MALTLLAVLLVLACAYALPDLLRLRDFSWLRVWLARWPGADDGVARAAAAACCCRCWCWCSAR